MPDSAQSQAGSQTDVFSLEHESPDIPSPATVPPPPLSMGVDEYCTIAPSATQENESPITLGSIPEADGTNLGPRATVPGYEILGELGRGGMGVVYKARQVALNRLVALKMILAGGHAGEDEIARFRTEEEAIARLQHPGIIQIYEVGDYEGLPFFSLEFCPSGSLDRKLAGTPQPPREAALLVETLALAIQHAHEHGIIHRDLKPANILLTASGQPKITDFGLAKKFEDRGQTASGAIMGTPSYMSPEQAAGKTQEMGPACDIYSLGAILYELLTGRPPFKANTPMDTVLQVLKEEAVPPTRLQSRTPRDLETICLKCLAKTPNERYRTCRDLADDLRRWLEDQPILARPAGWLERAVKWSRRKPAQAALVGVSLFALLSLLAAAGVASRYQYQQAQAAGKEVERLRHLEHVKAQINDNLVAAKVHETAERWGEAGTALTTALAVLDAQQELGDEDLRADVARSLAAVQARQGARQRLEQFRPLRLDALFHETPLPGTDSRTAANPERARVAARAALAHYRLEAKNNTNPAIALLGDDRQYLTREEHAEAVEGCYELLLVWAETLSPASQTGRREDLARRTQAQQALDLLEQAGRLGKAFGLDTQTYHLRKARYRDVAQGKMADTLFPREAPAEPTGALDWFLKGLESYRKGLFDESSRACAQALRLQGKHFWARYVQALCLLRSGRWVDARAALTTCLHERPDFPWARVLRGFASSELSKTPGEFTEAQADFDAFLTDRDPLLRYVALVNRGVLFVRQQRWSDAAHDLELAAKLKPDGFQAYVNLAQAYRGAGRLREALAMLNRGIGLAPDMERLYEVRSNLRLELKDRPGARQDLEKAISLESQPGPSPRLPGLYLELGKLLQSGEENNEALRAYDRALALQPKSALAHHLRAEALLALDRRDEAGQALDRYFDLDRQPKADAYQIRGLLHAGAGRYPAAIEMYTMALRLQPNDAKIRNHRGWTYLLLESSGAALADFQTCLERAPENAEALVGRGTSVLRLAREVDCVERAVADAEAAEKHGPMSANLLYKLACLYSQARSRLEAAPRGRSARLPAQRLDLYEKQALQRLRLVAKETPLTGKARLWRQIETEPALAPLRRRPAFAALAAEYRPPAR